MATQASARQPVAFVGTGNMGGSLIELLLETGHAVTVWNRTTRKAEALRGAGARVAASAAEAAGAAEVVFSILGGDESLEEVFFSGGALPAIKRGAIHIGMSTISPQMGERLAGAHAAHGSHYVACPMFGRPEAARVRQLWLVAAGSRMAFERVRPLLESLGRGLTYLGETPAHAHLAKLAGNFLIASALEAMAECFALVERGNLNRESFMEVMNQVFRSPIYQNYGRMVGEGPVEPAAFTLRWGLKDLKLVRAAADDVGTPLPLADLVYQHMMASLARGRGDRDWTTVGEIARENAGLPSRVA